MNDLQYIINFVNFILNKEQTGRSVKPEEWNIIFPYVNFAYFKRKFGLTEEFKPGMPFSKSAWEVVQQITDSLGVFKVIMGDTNSPMIIDSDGHADKPSDYLHVSSIRYIKVTNDANCGVDTRLTPIEILTDAEWAHVVGSRIRPPSFNYPVAMFQNTYIQFLPKNLQYVEFTYLRTPVTPVYAYTLNATTDEVTYNQSGSTQFEWEENDISDIIMMILEYCGLNLKEDRIVQLSELKKQTGQ